MKRKDEWKWTAMIMQPKIVTEADFNEALVQVKKKNLPAIDKVCFEVYHEGKAAQILNVGPYSEEGPNIKKIYEQSKQAPIC